MSDCYLTLEEVKLNTSYKTYITNFFSYTKSRHRIQYLYDENDDYVGNFNNNELYDILRWAGIGIRRENYNDQ